MTIIVCNCDSLDQGVHGILFISVGRDIDLEETSNPAYFISGRVICFDEDKMGGILQRTAEVIHKDQRVPGVAIQREYRQWRRRRRGRGTGEWIHRGCDCIVHCERRFQNHRGGGSRDRYCLRKVVFAEGSSDFQYLAGGTWQLGEVGISWSRHDNAGGALASGRAQLETPDIARSGTGSKVLHGVRTLM